MRCRKCGANYSLECGLGPGGHASPGQYLAVGIGTLIGALLFGVLGSMIGAAVFGLVGVFVLFECLRGCGYQEPYTAYHGSVCPKCGARNWIWPWNF